jgi:hypothetical protein
MARNVLPIPDRGYISITVEIKTVGASPIFRQITKITKTPTQISLFSIVPHHQ